MRKILFGLTISLMCLMLPAIAWADAPTSGRAGRAELRFLQGMIDHHQMALDMAQDCLAKASTESVVTLCQNVVDAQTPEIELMSDWLQTWYSVRYEPVSMYPFDAPITSGGHQHGAAPAASDPAMMMGMMAGLNRLSGVDYEIAWLEAMIDHHDDALHMSERVLRRAEHPELIALANDIITAQTTEIEAMEALIEALSAS